MGSEKSKLEDQTNTLTDNLEETKSQLDWVQKENDDLNMESKHFNERIAALQNYINIADSQIKSLIDLWYFESKNQYI